MTCQRGADTLVVGLIMEFVRSKSDMQPLVVPTERLELVVNTPQEALAQIESLPPEQRAEVSPVWLERLLATPEPDPWIHGFAMRSRATGQSVGGCGFKGPPDEDGMVEIAYGVATGHEGLGYATEAARALKVFAVCQPTVRVVRAHSKPENRASARVLEKSGFQRVGEVIDPEDGLVIRWEYVRGSASESTIDQN